MTEHTSLPWAATRDKDWLNHSCCYYSALTAFEGGTKKTLGEVLDPQDAALIVRAVNNYDTLVKALEQCQRVLAMMVEPDRINRTSSMQAWTEAVAAETGARIALSHLSEVRGADRG